MLFYFTIYNVNANFLFLELFKTGFFLLLLLNLENILACILH